MVDPTMKVMKLSPTEVEATLKMKTMTKMAKIQMTVRQKMKIKGEKTSFGI